MTENLLGNGEGPKAPGRRERKAAEMRERIFRAAIELIAQRGLDNVTVEQITGRADVGKGTFFNYFSNKEAVLSYFLATQVQRLEEALANGEVTGSAREQVECVLGLLARHADMSRELVRGLFIAALSAPQPPDVHGPNVWQLQDALTEIIRQGQSSGEFRRDINAAEAGQFILGQYFLGMLGWGTRFSEGTLLEVVQRFCRMGLDGLTA